MSTLKKVLLGVILLTAVAVSGVHFFDLPHIAKAETNAAPPFTVTDMNGQTVSLASLKGKPVFLNFWATWCPPCVGEMPDIQRMYAKYGDKVHFVIVNIDGTKPDVTAFMENHAFSSPLHLIRTVQLLQPMPFRPYQQVISLMLIAMSLTAISAH